MICIYIYTYIHTYIHSYMYMSGKRTCHTYIEGRLVYFPPRTVSGFRELRTLEGNIDQRG